MTVVTAQHRAVVTYHNMFRDAQSAELPLVAVAAAHKLMDYIICLYMKGM